MLCIPAGSVLSAQRSFEAEASAAFVVLGHVMRARVYVDGFNLYYRALGKGDYRWLDLLALSRKLLDPDDAIDVVRYFTARVSSRAGAPSAPKKQQAYLSALSSLSEVRVHYGRFIAKTKWRPLVEPDRSAGQFVQVHDTEEKGSDVNLAAHLLNDGWRDRYDVALVMSQDTDLCEPIRMVTQDMKKLVGLVWLDGKQPNGRLSSVSSFVRHATPARLAGSQFPDPVKTRKGAFVNKPEDW